MTLQQLEYIVSVEQHRHFAKAAKACGVTQSTLSSMIQKLESELDVTLFDRNSHPVKPSTQGEAIIAQAKVVLFNSSQIKEMVLSQREQECGELKLGIIPTVAPYIIPKLIKEMHTHHPEVHLHINEAPTTSLIKMLQRAEIDVALMATPLEQNQLLEIPIYYENFVAYLSPESHLYGQSEVDVTEMNSENLWVLQEGHCLRNQTLNICHKEGVSATIYEAGSIDTLIKIVNVNGGYTIIPQLHLDILSTQERKNIRPLSTPQPNREISLVIRKDFIRERLLNILSHAIRSYIPDEMVDSRLKRYAIKI